MTGAERKLFEHALEALTWCGGSDDFAPGGKASVGWRSLVMPTIEALARQLGLITDEQRRAWFDRTFPRAAGILTNPRRPRRPRSHKAVRS